MSNQQMINEILQAAKNGGSYIGGDLFFTLVFRTTKELIVICAELNIKTN